MRRIAAATVFLSYLVFGQLFAHSGKPKYHVVIDTDGALDDMRSITMLLAGNDVRVLAITCSQGTLLPDSAAAKVRSLLSAYHHEGIPVGTGEPVNLELPPWGPFAQKIQWADPVHAQDPEFHARAGEVLDKSLENYPEKITLVALGSLKTYADWIRSDPALAGKIERILWYNDRNLEKGYNYSVSPESYRYILRTGIPLEVLSGNPGDMPVGEAYLEEIGNARSIYADRIRQVHAQPGVAGELKGGHLWLWDDLVPLYLTIPLLFESEPGGNLRHVSLNRGLPAAYIYETIRTLLESATATNNRVFLDFPRDTLLYKPEYARILEETVEKYGRIEWKAVSMTNEIHGHTGIYSIIGAKMGIRAMEYFNVGVNNLEVTTFAGFSPPLSCFNDGIQISTGATIGQGLIRVSDSISAVPSALFEFNNRRVCLSLKPGIAEQMRKEIKYGVETYGSLTAQYWLYIERLAIQYWTSFDRYEIFDIEAR